MNLPKEIQSQLSDEFGALLDFQPVFGGSINNAACVKTRDRELFIKWNNALAYPGMFEAEMNGLDLLRATGNVRIPHIYQFLEGSKFSGLTMQYIRVRRGTNEQWFDFGHALAQLHGNSSEVFGLDHDNYMGSLKQSNGQHMYFPDFFIEERLKPQLRLAMDNGLLTADDSRVFDQVFKRIAMYYGDERPSLVHGDLWGGNVIFDNDAAYMIDPAAAYSSKFTDLAMTTMFGRFPQEFYRGYGPAAAMIPEEHWDLLKLYPLLIHVNLFGKSYLSETKQILRHYTA